MQSNKAIKKNIQWDKYMVYLIFVGVFLVFAVVLGNKGFLSANNIINILRQTTMISIMAVAGTLVMAAGQIDLTVGAVAAMTAMIVSLILQSTNSIFLALVAGILFGCLIGVLNGILVRASGFPCYDGYDAGGQRKCDVDYRHGSRSDWKQDILYNIWYWRDSWYSSVAAMDVCILCGRFCTF